MVTFTAIFPPPSAKLGYFNNFALHKETYCSLLSTTSSHTLRALTSRLPIPPPPRNRTPLRHPISNLPIPTDIENRPLPMRPSCIRPILIRRQPESGIASLIIQILPRERIFAPLGTIRQWRIGEPVFRGVVGGLWETLNGVSETTCIDGAYSSSLVMRS